MPENHTRIGSIKAIADIRPYEHDVLNYNYSLLSAMLNNIWHLDNPPRIKGLHITDYYHDNPEFLPEPINPSLHLKDKNFPYATLKIRYALNLLLYTQLNRFTYVDFLNRFCDTLTGFAKASFSDWKLICSDYDGVTLKQALEINDGYDPEPLTHLERERLIFKKKPRKKRNKPIAKGSPQFILTDHHSYYQHASLVYIQHKKDAQEKVPLGYLVPQIEKVLLVPAPEEYLDDCLDEEVYVNNFVWHSFFADTNLSLVVALALASGLPRVNVSPGLDKV